MSAAGYGAVGEELWHPKVNPWIIAGAVSLAAFMEVLDTSIANVALPHIAGGLAASNDESTWVLTSYLVSNAIVLPLSGWLVASLGRKRFFLICITFFTVSSFLCGIAPSLGFLLLFRVLQGAFGGGLQPMAQSILGDSFAPEKRGLAFSLYGITTICAPAIGPTLGGWITDNYSWRWIFYINVPVGIVALLLVSQFVEDPPYIARLKARLSGFDFIGFSLLTVGVGALQIVLDKGQEDDWFGSHFITTLVVIAVAGLVSLVIWEWFQKQPIVDVRLFKNFNVATTNLMFLMLGAALFSSTVLMPQLLQTLMGYTAQKAGNVLSAGALVVLVVLPLVGKLSTRFQARYIIAFGWLTLAIAMYVSSKQTDLLMSFRSATFTCVAVHSRGLSICPPHACRICRAGAGKNQCCRRAHEFLSQYGAERWDVRGHNSDCSTQSVSSIRLSGIHSLWAVSQLYHSSCNTTDALRLERACRSTTGARPTVRHGAGPSWSSLLRRYLLAARNGVGDYVCRFISAEKK